MKRGILAALALCLLLQCLPAVAGGDVLYVVNPEANERLNLRDSASTKSTVLGRLYTGTAVEVLRALDQFTHVRIGETEGYLSNAYLSPERKDWDSGTWLVVNVERDGEGLNMRQKPNKNSTSYDLVFNGTTVQFLENAGDYTKVRTREFYDAYLLSAGLCTDGDANHPLVLNLTCGKTTREAELMSFPAHESKENSIMSLGTVPEGTILKVIKPIGLWYYVEVQGASFPAGVGQRGFLPYNALRVGTYVEGIPPINDVYAVVKTEKESIRLPMRATPAMTGRLIETYINGSQVQLLDGTPDPNEVWWHVRVGIQEGYMLSKWLEPVENGPPTQWD